MRDGKLANALSSAATAKISALKKFKNIIIKNVGVSQGFWRITFNLKRNLEPFYVILSVVF